ncbi:hypothetical protein OHR86_12730 [Streptomyces sp. NBC_00441]|uniref:hypothetical protein n=1 Tax=Streptomyces sp. NBC_00441 TaxID=2975742 RepID=UPI002E2BC3F2|nr:hypothetical protein [Streptomyces sp. NBC_00441]
MEGREGIEAPPSAYWVVTLTRARLEPPDGEPPVFTVTAVEAPGGLSCPGRAWNGSPRS